MLHSTLKTLQTDKMSLIYKIELNSNYRLVDEDDQIERIGQSFLEFIDMTEQLGFYNISNGWAEGRLSKDYWGISKGNRISVTVISKSSLEIFYTSTENYRKLSKGLFDNTWLDHDETEGVFRKVVQFKLVYTE